jgi:hypothetical protein
MMHGVESEAFVLTRVTLEHFVVRVAVDKLQAKRNGDDGNVLFWRFICEPQRILTIVDDQPGVASSWLRPVRE